MQGNNYDLLAKYFSDKLSPEEAEKLRKWRSTADSEQLFNDLEHIWLKSKDARVFSRIDSKEAHYAVLAKTQSSQNQRKFPTSWKVAASIAILIGFSLLLLTNSQEQWTEVSSGESRKEYRLPDGSTVTLNRNSTLRVSKKFGTKRRVELEGEGFFQVVRNPKNPFIVKSTDLVTEVLGTSFNINSTDSISKVSVESGKVKVASASNESMSLILEKGETAVYEEFARSLSKTVNPPNFLSWKTGKFFFSEASLNQALEVLVTYLGLQLTIDGDLTDCQLTSQFDNPTTEEIMSEMELLFPMEFEVHNDTILVKGTCN